jgi:ketosteroid isomerase-like protein
MSQESLDVMRAGFEAVDRDDLDAFLALAHPKIEFRSLIAEAEGRNYQGHEGVREWWDTVIRSLRIRPGVEEIEGFRDRGIARLRLMGTVAGVVVPQTMWMGWRVRNGQIIWWATYRTETEALEAAGLAE